MALNDNLYPRVKGINVKPDLVTADDSETTINSVPAGATIVQVVGVTNDANDFIVLPRLELVENGQEITILCSAGSNFEMRTPAGSNNKINNVDSDGGAQEYLCTDTEIIKLVKIDDTIGWMAHAYSAIGAVVDAVVPHAV